MRARQGTQGTGLASETLRNLGRDSGVSRVTQVPTQIAEHFRPKASLPAARLRGVPPISRWSAEPSDTIDHHGRMFYVEEALRKRGGVARTWELIVDGVDPFFIELAADKRRITRLRQGWYALNDLDPAIARAVRLGGTLACRSALEHYGEASGDGRLHVALGSSSRPQIDDSVVVHWTRTRLSERCPAVSREEAERQAARCTPNPRAASLGRVS